MVKKQSKKTKKKTEKRNIKKLQEKAEKIIAELDKLIPEAKIALNFSNPWELYVAVVLSARNRDDMVNKVTENLFKKYRTLDDYANANIEEFAKDINKLGLYKQKAKYIITAAKIIKEKYNGNLPDTMEELIKLPGVGRKTANIILWNAFKKAEGIAVDTHVRRLSRLFGLTKSTNPDKIEKDLMEIIPKERWGDLPYKLIDYGRKYCTARCKHKNCPLRKFVV
ncbi:MAG: endonuclease III [Minisyncoccia bacterium]|jgi:endonuclease-3